MRSADVIWGGATRPTSHAMLGREARGELERRYEEVLAEHGGAMRRLASSYEADPDRAEDLFQEICLAVWRALPRFRGDSSLRTFVFRVAHNRGLSHGWRECRQPKPTGETPELPDERPDPQARYEQREDSARLYRAIRRLPPLSRQVLTLRLEGVGFAEIAEILGQSENNVMVRASRARKTLRELLADEPPHREENA